MGKTIQQHHWTASAANNTLTIDLGTENKGVYFVSIGNGLTRRYAKYWFINIKNMSTIESFIKDTQ